jgi:hypothetical protein
MVILFIGFNQPVIAEEGMWTFDNLPLKDIKEKYNFEPSKDWIEHTRLAAVKFDRGSGSFISSTGLALTNHHVIRGHIQKISTPEKDYVKNGFYAKTLAEEIKCPDMELKILVNLENVTGKIEKAAQGLSEKEAILARNKEVAKIEKESKDGNIVVLYRGGEYWLYTYKVYKDVRLVFAPEDSVSLFGGRYDNFTYPRYDLDFAIVRAYENGKPAQIKHYFKTNPKGVKENELVFVVGHPGSTSRLQTYSQILLLKDCYYPNYLEYLKDAIATLENYASKGPEQKRQVIAEMHSKENYLKRAEGEYAGLRVQANMENFKQKENQLKQNVQKMPELKDRIGDPWGKIDKAVEDYKSRYKRYYWYTQDERLMEIGLKIVRMVNEVKKPDSERLGGYHDSQLSALKKNLLSPAPIYKEMEEAILAGYLEKIKEKIGENDPYVKTLLGGKTPQERAKELIAGTKLNDPNFRKTLIEKGEEAVLKSDDPIIKLALQLDPTRREIKKWSDLEYGGVLDAQHEKISNVRFKIYGKSVYPDATSTLRVSYGVIKGYPYNGTICPFKTTLFGMYDRYFSFGNKDGLWDLPKRYLDNMKNIDLSTTLDFVYTCDTIGGNSGSPVINKNAEIIGLNFDSNMEGLIGRYYYESTKKRSIAVSMSAIVEVLDNIYGAKELVKEILEK